MKKIAYLLLVLACMCLSHPSYSQYEQIISLYGVDNDPSDCVTDLMLVIDSDYQHGYAHQYYVRRGSYPNLCEVGLFGPGRDTIHIEGYLGFNQVLVDILTVGPIINNQDQSNYGTFCGGSFNPCWGFFREDNLSITVGTDPNPGTISYLNDIVSTANYHCNTGYFTFHHDKAGCYNEPFVQTIGTLDITDVNTSSVVNHFDFSNNNYCGQASNIEQSVGVGTGTYAVHYEDNQGATYDTTLFFPPSVDTFTCHTSLSLHHLDLSHYEGCNGSAYFNYTSDLPCSDYDEVQVTVTRTDITADPNQFSIYRYPGFPVHIYGGHAGTYHFTMDEDVCHTEGDFTITDAPAVCDGVLLFAIDSSTCPNCYDGDMNIELQSTFNCSPWDVFYNEDAIQDTTAHVDAFNGSTFISQLAPGTYYIHTTYAGSCSLDTIVTIPFKETIPICPWQIQAVASLIPTVSDPSGTITVQPVNTIDADTPTGIWDAWLLNTANLNDTTFSTGNSGPAQFAQLAAGTYHAHASISGCEADVTYTLHPDIDYCNYTVDGAVWEEPGTVCNNGAIVLNVLNGSGVVSHYLMGYHNIVTGATHNPVPMPYPANFGVIGNLPPGEYEVYAIPDEHFADEQFICDQDHLSGHITLEAPVPACNVNVEAHTTAVDWGCKGSIEVVINPDLGNIVNCSIPTTWIAELYRLIPASMGDPDFTELLETKTGTSLLNAINFFNLDVDHYRVIAYFNDGLCKDLADIDVHNVPCTATGTAMVTASELAGLGCLGATRVDVSFQQPGCYNTWQIANATNKLLGMVDTITGNKDGVAHYTLAGLLDQSKSDTIIAYFAENISLCAVKIPVTNVPQLGCDATLTGAITPATSMLCHTGAMNLVLHTTSCLNGELDAFAVTNFLDIDITEQHDFRTNPDFFIPNLRSGDYRVIVAYSSGLCLDTFTVNVPNANTAVEVCDGEDNDCDGQIDEDVSTVYYRDADGDGFGNPLDSHSFCNDFTPSSYVLNYDDCDDTNPDVHTSEWWYLDHDNDGHYINSVFACGPPTSDWNRTGGEEGDCNDASASVYREGLLFVDADDDQYDNGGQNICYGASIPLGYSDFTFGPDCNDHNATVHEELLWFLDADNDGYYVTSQMSCGSPGAGYHLTGGTAGDCNDNNASVFRSVTLYVDVDGDGYDNGNALSCIGSSVPHGYALTTLGSDCRDDLANVHPGANEICGNGIDDNCNGVVDEGCMGITAVIANTICTGTSVGSINITVSGGTNPKTYLWSNSAVTEDLTGLAAGIYFVTVTDHNNSSSSASFTVGTSTPSAKPATPGTIAGTVTVCPDLTTYTYSIAAVTNAGSYTWTVPVNCNLISGQGTTAISVQFTSLYTTGAVSVKANNCIGSSAVKSLTIAKQAKPLTPGTITGTLGVCPGSTYSYSIAAVANATSYTWTAPAHATIETGQGTNSVTVSFQTGYVTAILSVTASNCGGASAAKTLSVTLAAKPLTPGTITGTLGVCLGNTYAYSIVAVAGATSYTWTPAANSTIVSGQGTNSVTVSFQAGYVTSLLSVTASNCGGTSAAKTLSVTKAATPLTPGTITGAVSVCPGTYNYSIVAVANATSYTWTVPASATLASGQGTNAITVTYPNGYTSSALSVVASNCGGASAAKTITVAPASIAPAVPGVITGALAVCPGTYTYSIVAVANALSYNWTAPANASITSGQGTTTVSVTFVSGFSTGNLSVTASNCVATSAAKILALKTVPAAPAAITGPISDVCGTTTGIVYSVVPILGASSYNWVVTGGAITGGLGTTSITVDFPANFATATVKVQEVTSCSSAGAFKSITVSQKANTPGAITGPSPVCPTLAYNYSVAAVDNATFYTWTVPSDWLVTNGQGTNSLDVTAGAAAGKVTVTATNACGTGTAASKTIAIGTTCRLGNVEATAIGEEPTESKVQMKVYPNPADGNEVNIELRGINDAAEITVFDYVGQKVMAAQSIADGVTTLNIAALSAGIYTVELHHKNGRKTERLVIQK